MRLIVSFGFAVALMAQPAIDFSYAGYGGGGVPTPVVPAAISVRPSGGDDTALLQGALDRVAALPLRVSGFRGAVLLRPGRYLVSGRLQMRVSGVVLRGSDSATIVAAGKGRRTLIEIGSSAEPVTEPPLRVTDEVAPAGSRTFTLENPGGLKVGDRVVITRPSTAEWIAALKMRGQAGNYAAMRIDWTPGSRNLVWDRCVTQIEAGRSQVTVDAPITTALERRYGGGTVARYASGGHGQGRSADRSVLDSFVREHLARTLMQMQPRDGVAEDPEQTWCLADERGESVLFYSLAGPSIRLTKTLSTGRYGALWFDPRTGTARPMEAPVTARAGDVIPQPTAEAWLVLLRPGN